MKDGILNINKPQGMTSHDVVRDLRRLLGVKKIGHTGTLDPMATGVLPICIGRATRITEYTDLDLKKYRCTLRLGLVTDTQDIWGEILEENSTAAVTTEAAREAFSDFRGKIMQKPPMYSAVRVAGRRLYDYARAGETVEVKEREVYISALQIEAMDFAHDSDVKKITFTVECSKGTYIRTICQDVGRRLGCGAAMESLERLASGPFKIEESIDLYELVDTYSSRRFEGEKYFVQQAEDDALRQIEKLILPADYPLIHFGTAIMDGETARRFIDGWHISMKECEITQRPEFEEKAAPMEIRPEYRGAYKMYRRIAERCKDGAADAADDSGQSALPAGEASASGSTAPGSMQFLGVAFYSPKYKKLVADKVFCRNDE